VPDRAGAGAGGSGASPGTAGGAPGPRRGGRHGLRVCALYPDLMNIYADRGNLLVLQRRCAWRQIEFRLASSGLGEQLDPDAYDLFYLGGGQDRDQLLCAQDLLETKAEPLRAAAARGAVVLGICGGYQLLGHSYALGGEEVAGVGLLDAHTVREEGPRLIGNIAIDVSSWTEADGDAILAGFENHGGRTRLGARQPPLGIVLRGHGNDGRSGAEGARSPNTFGTYLHGPLLPKNTWFADWLIARALRIAPSELAPLEDSFEQSAHLDARRAAGV
jgi:CobQ-like glutamine amidotransferase family enzyme